MFLYNTVNNTVIHIPCPMSSKRPCLLSNTAVPHGSVRIWTPVKAAAQLKSPTTPAVIAIAPSARRLPRNAGLIIRNTTFSTLDTSMSYLLCQTSCGLLYIKISTNSIRCYSKPLRKHCRSLPLTRNSWAQPLGLPLYFIHGDKTLCFILIYTASFRQADLMVWDVGFIPEKSSFSPCVFSPINSRVSSCTCSKRKTLTSLENRRIYTSHTIFSTCWTLAIKRNGSSTANRPSNLPPVSSSTSDVTRTALLSPITVSSVLRMVA